MTRLLYLAWPALALAAPSAALACAACGCNLDGDAAIQTADSQGWRLSLQYDFIDQSQLRHGSSAASASQPATVNDAGGNQEVEQRTINRYLTFGIDYAPNADWSLSARLPVVDRSHTTYGNAGAGQLTPDNVSGADFTRLGDIKLLAGYRSLWPGHHLELQFGIKLPTGAYGGQNINSNATVGQRPVFFSRGPNAAAGQALDTSLQPGTGSTDLIVGLRYRQALSPAVEAYASGQFQAAVAERLNETGADFRPGNQASISLGLSYLAHASWTPRIQLNASHKTADQGALADTENTAGTMVYLSPGVSFNAQKNLQLYGFVQLPVYSKLSGYQLFPRWSGSLGISYAF